MPSASSVPAINRQHELTTHVAHPLSDLNPAKRYFGYVNSCPGRPKQTTLRSSNLGAAVTEAGLQAKDQHSEGFFQLFESDTAPTINALLRGVHRLKAQPTRHQSRDTATSSSRIRSPSA